MKFNTLARVSSVVKLLASVLSTGLMVHGQTVTTTLTSVDIPYLAAVNPVTNKIYVLNNSNQNLTVIDGVSNSIIASVAVGAGFYSLGVNPVTNRIYVANQGSNNVTVIDGASNTVITTVPAGAYPSSIAMNPVTNKIYIANYGSNNVTVIDGATNSVTATIAAGVEPTSVAINPVTNKIYVASDWLSNFSYVTVIDGATNQATLVPGGPLGPDESIVLNPLTNQIYVPSEGHLIVIDGATNNTITVGGVFAWTAAVNPVTNKIYAPNDDSPGVIAVIDGATNITASVSTGTAPSAVAVNPLTNKIYTANQDGTVTVIDGTGNSAPATVAAGNTPDAVAVNPVTNKIYVANKYSANVTVIDGASNSPTTVAAGTTPVSIAVNPVTNQIYVANFNYGGAGSVTVINGANNSTTPVAVGTNPASVAVNAVTNKIYVANSGSNNVTVIDGASNSTTSVAAGTYPYSVAVNSVTNKIYVANYDSASITVIDGNNLGNMPLTVAVGTHPISLAVNALTNKIYVANFDAPGSVTVIDGATNNTVAVAAGTAPVWVTVNQTTNKIYVANQNSDNVTVIDGATNSVTTVAAGSTPISVAVNPVTNRIYIANRGGNTVTVIDEQQVEAIPLTTSITPLANNQTYNSTPSFTFNSQSTTVTVPDGVYFQLDTWQGAWSAASGSNPTYTGTLPSLQPGLHILYAYAVDGQEASTSSRSDLSVSPLDGAMQAYGFLVLPPLATTMTVAANPVPGLYGQPVTLTAKVTVATGTPSGTVAFFFKSLLLGDGALNTNGVATVTTSALPVGNDLIKATYYGNAMYLASAASVTEPIAAPPTVVSLTPSSGTGTTQTFSGVYADPNGTADLASVGMLFNSALSAVKACAVYYYPSSNLLYLENDGGTGLTAGVTPGSSSTVSNSQCTLSGTGSSTSVSGNDLTMNVALIFSATFLGPKNVYLAASDINSTASGWLLEGAWTPASPAGSAKYTGLDTTTQGTWTGKYGADGYIIPLDTTALPAYAAVSLTGESTYAWALSTTDPRALQTASGSASRRASTYYSATSFTINVSLTDGNTHRIGLYLLDWDGTSRAETISVLDANTNAILDSEKFSSFHGGEYAVWNVRGHVLIQVTRTAGSNAVVNGIFFDPLAAAASYSGLDTATQGNWTGQYGASGEVIANDLTNLAAFATVSLTSGAAYTWAASTTDVGALQIAGGSSTRIASTYYSATSFTMNVNLTDGNTHKISLYLLDWDGSVRAESISFLDANSNTVLNSETFSSFHNGEYAAWNVQGHVLIQVTRTGGSNAVVSGIFVD